MVIKKVSFDCTIAMPGYNNVKPGIVEAELESGETIEQAWSELNRRAKEWHKTEYPHLYIDTGMSDMGKRQQDRPDRSLQIPEIQSKKTPEEDRIAQLIADIYSCTEIKVLESYNLMVRADPQLQAAYNMQLIKLNLPKPQIND